MQPPYACTAHPPHRRLCPAPYSIASGHPCTPPPCPRGPNTPPRPAGHHATSRHLRFQPTPAQLGQGPRGPPPGSQLPDYSFPQRNLGLCTCSPRQRAPYTHSQHSDPALAAFQPPSSLRAPAQSRTPPPAPAPLKPDEWKGKLEGRSCKTSPGQGLLSLVPPPSA